MAKTCPSVARAQLQSVFVVLEDVSGELQPPTKEGYIVPAGRATMTQTPTYSDSEELSPSLNVLKQFPNSMPAGTGSIPLFGRLNADYSKPEGDALLVALMGDYNDPSLITASVQNSATSSATEIVIDDIVNENDIENNILAGKFPPRGVVKIGSEHIRYKSISYADDGSATLHNCARGYANTTPADIEADATVQLLSRVYSQSVCSQTCSVYILNDDKLCLFMSGCNVIQDTVRLQRDNGQMYTFDIQGRRMGWCGVGELLTAPTGATIKLTAGGADAYTVGGYIRNRTKNDDNNGKGYHIIAVDDANDTLTLATSPTGWQAGDALHPWLPGGEPIGTPLESKTANVEIDGVAGKMESGGLTISCPVTNLEEIGDDFVGEGINTKRSLTLERSIYFRAQDAVEFGRGYRGYELPVSVITGRDPGLTLVHYMGRVQFGTPEINESNDVVTMTQNGTALGITGEDSLFIIQE